jgi:hypothetical protein
MRTVQRTASSPNPLALALALALALLRAVAPALALPTLAAAQQATTRDANVLFPIPVIEQRMRFDSLVVIDVRGSRAEGDRTQRVVLTYPDSSTMLIKWAKSAPGGSAFNNEPRYEIAAYELQKLFLDEDDYVVPPTLARAVPVDWFRRFDPEATPTFDDVNSVVLVMQYWLSSVTNEGFWDRKRFDTDTLYARYLANFNILTHLIRHSDSNSGNFLISQYDGKPRVFSVDNGVSFRSDESNRGFEWRELRVNRLPRATVERLRAITPEDLQRTLGVVAHFDRAGDQLVLGQPGENFNPGRGVRRSPAAVQFGLTASEIRDVENRLRRLLQRVDQGRIQVF